MDNGVPPSHIWILGPIQAIQVPRSFEFKCIHNFSGVNIYICLLKHTMQEHTHVIPYIGMSSGNTNSHLAVSHYCSQFGACQLWRNCTRSSHMCENESVSRATRFSQIKDVEKSQKSVKKQTQRR